MLRPLVVSSMFAMVLAVVPAFAQEPAAPAGWTWQPEGITPVSDSTRSFAQMPPGWHITTATGGLLYPVAERASGHFSLAADFVVFPETTNTGFGLFLAGARLDEGGREYLAALLRRDGAVSIVKSIQGIETVLVPWTKHSAIKPHPGTGVVTNRLRLNASADSLRVFVNDSSVVRIGLQGAGSAGQFGFKVGHGVNLHITILDHIRHLAPPRSR